MLAAALGAILLITFSSLLIFQLLQFLFKTLIFLKDYMYNVLQWIASFKRAYRPTKCNGVHIGFDALSLVLIKFVCRISDANSKLGHDMKTKTHQCDHRQAAC